MLYKGVSKKNKRMIEKRVREMTKFIQGGGELGYYPMNFLMVGLRMDDPEYNGKYRPSGT
jgi:hypothetical protein